MNISRKRRVIENMQALGLKTILISSPYSIFYLTGRFIQPGERMLVLALSDNGDTRLFVNRMFAQASEPDMPVTEFDDTEDAVAILAEYLPSGVIGIDKEWASGFTIRLMEARKDIKPVLGSAPVDNARLLKDDEEIALMLAASHLNDTALMQLIPTISIGDTELEVCGRYTDIVRKLGAKSVSFTPLVCFGANGAEPHHDSDASVLTAGQGVILDLGLQLEHYMSDMTRTVFMGKPDAEFKRVYEIVLSANAAAKRMVKPGVLMSDIDRAARSVIEDAGYGEYFIHRTGHGIGLQVHEPTDASSSNHAIAKPGMVFSIEPGIYLPGRLGVRIEDLVAVTSDGCLVLNELDRELKEL